jgi:hypothetical protein
MDGHPTSGKPFYFCAGPDVIGMRMRLHQQGYFGGIPAGFLDIFENLLLGRENPAVNEANFFPIDKVDVNKSRG